MINNEEIIEIISALSLKHKEKTLRTGDIEKHLLFTRKLPKARFGSTKAALKAAGVSQAKVGRRYTDDECYKNQLIVWTHFGRPPTYRGMGYPPLVVGGSAYRRRFGTWNRALAAFVERVNSDDKIEEVGDDQPRASFSDPAIQPKTQEDRRDVPLGLRFKVLKRDHFKCVLCGDHPARNSECVLHVDHILPWSLGGKTIEENLTTLCETCNLGRGNRYRD